MITYCLLQYLMTGCSRKAWFFMNNVFSNYKSFHYNAFQYEAYGRPMAGVSVFVHDSFKAFVKQIHSQCKF